MTVTDKLSSEACDVINIDEATDIIRKYLKKHWEGFKPSIFDDPVVVQYFATCYMASQIKEEEANGQ